MYFITTFKSFTQNTFENKITWGFYQDMAKAINAIESYGEKFKEEGEFLALERIGEGVMVKGSRPLFFKWCDKTESYEVWTTPEHMKSIINIAVG